MGGEDYMKKIAAVLAACIAAVVLTACFSNWKDDRANVTIVLGDGSGRSIQQWPPTGVNADMLNLMTYDIRLSGSEGSTDIKANGIGTATASVTPGLYDISINALYDGEQYAYGIVEGFDVKAGQVNTVRVPMSHNAVLPEFNIEMASIPAGTFTVNGTAVTLSGFYMGKYEVTQEQYRKVVGSNPSFFDNTGEKLINDVFVGNTSYDTTPANGEVQGKRPVEQVSWYDAIVFCNRLSIMKELTPAYSIGGSTDPDTWGAVPTGSNAAWNAVTIAAGSTGYRLPTEAQWQYAAQGGESAAVTITDATGWYKNNSPTMTHEVGKKQANVYGLYDMLGNITEWCWDWFSDTYPYTEIDPTGAASGSIRVIHGGSWNYQAESAVSTARGNNYPYYRYYTLGFRVVRPGAGAPEPAPEITITAQPAPVTIAAAGSAVTPLTVTANVSSQAPITYQWYENNTNSNAGGTIIQGAASSSYLPANLADGEYYYFVEISAEGAKSVRSNAAMVVVGYTSGLRFTPLQGEEYSVSIGDARSGHVVIPPVYDGWPVTSIGEFYNSNLTGITIPDSIKSIGRSAFWGSRLTSVTIPGSVTFIDEGAFGSCTYLTGITVDAGNSEYSSVEGVLFNKDQTTIVAYPAGIPGSYTIPNTVTSIGVDAFTGCRYLTGVTIPNSVTSIGGNAFANCSAITAITIPNSVTFIGYYAFIHCRGLVNITIPNSVTVIERGVFGNCEELISIAVDAGSPNFISVDGVLFSKDQTTLVAYPAGRSGSYNIPDSVTSIYDHAFYYSKNLPM